MAEMTYTIREAARACGLAESTLRYYESIGIMHKIKRDPSSRQRLYNEDDLNKLSSIACMNAIGMSLENMREYIQHLDKGSKGADIEIQLLKTQQEILRKEAARLKVRQRYVKLKVNYWLAVKNGDTVEAEAIAAEASRLVKDLQDPPSFK